MLGEAVGFDVKDGLALLFEKMAGSHEQVRFSHALGAVKIEGIKTFVKGGFVEEF